MGVSHEMELLGVLGVLFSPASSFVSAFGRIDAQA